MHFLDFEIRTLILLLFWGNLAATILLLTYRDGGDSRRPHRLFSVGKLLQAAAWFLLAQRGTLPDLLSVYLGNTLLFFGFVCESLALIAIFDRARRWLVIEACIGVVGTVLFWAFASTSSRRVAIATLITIVVFAAAIVVLLRAPLSSILRKSTLVLYGAFVTVLGCRVWLGFTTPTVSLLSPGAVQTLAFFTTVLVMFVGSIAFILLLKEVEDRKLTESEERYRALVETAKESILIVQDERVVFVNNGFLKLLDMTSESVLGRDFTEFVAAEDRELLLNNYRRRVSGVENRTPYDVRLLDRHGKTIWMTVSAARIMHKGRPASMALLTDISTRVEREAERDRLIDELRLALQEKKTLSGLLPICAHCKKIRDDQGYWKQIEVYIHSHSAVEFSHGVCPDCLEKWFPDEGADVRAEKSCSTQS